jgi:chromosome segregation ATPase
MELLKSLQDTLVSRIKNLFLMNFIFVWIFINYDFTFKILFDNKMDIDKTIEFIKNTKFNIEYMLLLPLFATFIYIFVLPYINLWINSIYDKHINTKQERLKRYKTIKHLSMQRKIEKVKLHNTHFLQRTMENKIKEEENIIEQKRIDNEENIKSRKKLITELEESNNAISNLKIEKTELEKKVESFKLLNNKLEDEKIEQERNIKKFNYSIEQYQTNYHNLEQEKKDLELNYHNLEQEKKDLELNYSNLEQEKKDLELNYHNLEQEKKDLELNYSNLEQEKKDLELNYNNLEQYKKDLELNYHYLENNTKNLELNYSNLEDQK